MLRIWVICFAALPVFRISVSCAQTAKPNIIFIVSDDLNDWIEGLGSQPQVHTPNLDSLIRHGMLFTNAYCNAPVCAPSRTSFLSGKDLYYTQVYDNNNYLDYFRDNFTAALGNEEVITLPQYLKDAAGYYTFGINKIFHQPASGDFDDATEDPCLKQQSWTRVAVFPDYGWVNAEHDDVDDGVTGYRFGKMSEADTDKLKDARAVDTAIQFINDIAGGSISPCTGAFFLALGLAFPHLDLFVPGNYFSPYYVDDFYAEPYKIPYNVPNNAYPYNGIVMPPQPDTVFSDYDKLGPIAKEISIGQKDLETTYAGYPDQLPFLPEIDPFLSDAQRREIISQSERANAVMAYIAAIEYMDAQVGRLMNTLKSYPDIYQNTVIIFVSDNGFTLGQKRHWLKRSLWEPDIRIPIIIDGPGIPENTTCNRTVSLVDIFPTLCDMAGVGYPSFADGSSYLDGQSLLPLLTDPARHWERPVLVTFEAEDNKDASCFPQYAVRNEAFSYIRYSSDNGALDPGYCDAATSISEEELYNVGANREVDPHEWHNLIDDPDYDPVKQYLQQFLPDSSLYLQKVYSADILSNASQCYFMHADTLHLTLSLYDPDGNFLPSLPAGYTAVWSLNLDPATYSGIAADIPLANIPPDVFASHSALFVYMHVFDQDGNLVGFNIRHYYINPASIPQASFDAVLECANVVGIENYVQSGTYNQSWWDFGDGTVLYDHIPAPHTYQQPGTYAVTNFLSYGNDSTCINSASRIVTVSDSSFLPDPSLLVYPVPADDYLLVHLDAMRSARVEVFAMTGQKVLEAGFSPQGCDIPFRLDVSRLSPGTYVIRAFQNDAEKKALFIVNH